MAKIIPVVGSPGSGSTTLAVQLALHCSEKKETVCLILTDPMLPPRSYLLKESQTNSLGFLLSFPDLSEKQILASMDAATDSIGVLGYATGDRLQDFPVPSTVACETLLKKLSMCTDTIILDVGSRLTDKLTITALEQADAVVVCVDGTIKSAAWQANLPQIPYCTFVANKVAGNVTAEADIFFPYAANLHQQMQELRGFHLYKEKSFFASMQQLHSKTNVQKKNLTLVR